MKTDYSVIFCDNNQDFIKTLCQSYNISKLYPLTLFLYDPIGKFTSNSNLIIGKLEGLFEIQSFSDMILNCMSSKVSIDLLRIKI